MKKKSPIEWIFQFWAWQVLAWTLYRYFFHLPEWADELIFKPLIFVLPVLWYVTKKEHGTLETVGMTTRGFTRNILTGCLVGALFFAEGIFMNMMRHGKLMPDMHDVGLFIPLSLATAVTEEFLCRGFYFTRIFTVTKKVWYAVILSTLLFMAFHIPILATTLKFHGMTLVLFFWTTVSLGVVNSIFYYKTQSLVVPILVHLFWNMTAVILL